MSESTTNKNVRDDEIDLLDLFRRMGRTFNRWGKEVGRGFLIAIVFLLKRWLPLVISVVLGVGISLMIKVASPSFYSSDLVLRNNIMSNADIISYINRLHTYCKEKNISALTNAISISEQKAYNILDVSAFWIIDKGKDGIPDYVDYGNNFNIYDTIDRRMLDRLDIRVKIKSPQELTDLRDGILAFINSDSLFQRRNKVRNRQIHEFLTRYNYDIVQLDSLQKFKDYEETKNRLPKVGGQMIFLQEQKTQLVYTDIQMLYSKKLALESERDLFNGIVTVLSEFPIPAKRVNGSFYYGKFIVSSFFFLTLLILIGLANRKKLKEVYEKY